MDVSMGSILYGGADANGGGAAAAPVEPGLSPLELKARLVTPKPKMAMLYQQLESLRWLYITAEV